MAKIFRIDLTRRESTIEKVPERYTMLGGRALTGRIILDEVDPLCDPLGGKNKLVIAPGFLTGTRAPNSGRLSIGGKSPLTGGIKESNSGGTVSRKLAKMGIKALILQGKPVSGQYIIMVQMDKVAILPAPPEVVGKGTYETMEILKAIYGHKMSMICTGQAGEYQLSAAVIAISDMDGLPNRQAARGGLGAVMGSKGVKAIIIDVANADETLLQISDSEGFNIIAKKFAQTLIETRKGLTTFGTPGLVKPVSAMSGLPTRNFSRGTFEKVDNVGPEIIVETIKSRGGKTGHICSVGCVIRCSNVYNDAEGKYVLSSMEYESLALLGPNLGIDSLDVIANLNRKCNDYGLDTIEMGVALGVAMEGGLAQFGDGKAAQDLLDEIAKGTVLGRMLGNGAAMTGKVLGIKRVPVVKGQAMAAYDPRAFKGTGVTYASSPMGADHTAGNLLPGRYGNDPHKSDGQIINSRNAQLNTCILDSMGLCLFVGDALDIVADLLTKATGAAVTVDDMVEMAKDVLKTELEFNKKACFTKADDRLPAFFKTEKLPPQDLVFEFADEELDKTINL
jgi:aldehyde:ferredoxin oxidoreductase